MYKATQPGATVEDQQQAMSAMNDFSIKNPTQPMLGVQAALRERMQGYAIGESAGFGMPLTGREVPVAQRKIGYAAMPQGQ
jgi:hypothetical protein